MKKKKVLITMLSASLVCAAAAVTFAACGEETLYNVTYEKGGTAVEGTLPTEAAHKEGEKFTIADNTLTNEGYEFDGWLYNGTTYEEGAEFTMPAADVTFKAKWAQLFTVTYEWDGDAKPEGAAEDAELPAATTVKYDTKLTLPTLAAKENYTFSGWKLASTGNIVGSPYTITANITLKAVFAKSGFFWVNYSFGEESHAASSAQLPPAKEVTKGSKVTLAPAPAAKSGWAFDGWDIRNTTNNAPVPLDEESEDTFTMPAFNVTITAKWVETFTVTYAWNTANNRPETGTKTDDNLPAPNRDVKSGATIQLPTLTGKDDYQFKGWQDEEGNLIPVADPYNYKVTGNVTLKAIFGREGYYMVTYNFGEYATNEAPETSEFKGGETYTIKETVTAADGWTFDKWVVTDADGEDVPVTANAFEMPNKAVTITATYKKLFTLTYELSGGSWAGAAPAATAAAGTEITLPAAEAATLDGFTLAGWKIDGDLKEPNTTFEVAKNLTITAVWSKTVAAPAALGWNTLTEAISLKYGQTVTVTADVNITGTAAWSGVFVGIGDKTDTTKNIHLRLDNWFADYTHNGAYQHQYGELLFKTEKEFLLTKNDEPVADWFAPLLSLYAHVKDYKAVADYTAEGRIVVTTTFNATISEDNYTYTGTATYTALNPHVALAQEYKLGIGGDSATATNLKYVLEGAVKEVPAAANPDHNFAGGDTCTLCGARKITTQTHEGVVEPVYTFVQRAPGKKADNQDEGWWDVPSTAIDIPAGQNFAAIFTGDNVESYTGDLGDKAVVEFKDPTQVVPETPGKDGFLDVRVGNNPNGDVWGGVHNAANGTFTKKAGEMPSGTDANWSGAYEIKLTFIDGTLTVNFTLTRDNATVYAFEYVETQLSFGAGTTLKLTGGNMFMENWLAYYGTLSAVAAE